MEKTDIKVSILGGQDERGKNSFFIETNESIYIFNSGVKIPLNSNLGISKISSNFDYLIENQSKIKGLFVGNPSIFNTGAIKFLIKKLSIKLPIYTSLIGQTIIETQLTNKVKNNKDQKIKYELIVCDAMKEIVFKNTKIVPFKVSSHIPFSFGWVIKTQAGNIINIDEFYINNDRNKLFESQLNQINLITKGHNDLLLVGVGNIEKNKGFTAPGHKTTEFYESIIKNNENGPILITLNEYNIYSLLVIANIAKKNSRPFVLYSISMINTFFSIIKNKLFSSKNLNCIPISEINKVKNPIIILMGSEENLFKTLFSITDYQMNNIQPNENWTLVLGTYLIPGYETHAAKLADELDRKNINYYFLPKTILPLTASNEDHKFLVDLLKPKHIIPTQSLFMNIIKYARVISPILTPDAQIHTLLNFDSFVLSSKKSYVKTKDIKNNNEVYINEAGNFDANENILLERKQMSTSGIVSLILYFNKETQKFMNEIDIQPVGLSFNPKDNSFEAIQEKFLDSFEKCIVKTKNGIDIKETKILLKKSLIRIFEKKMNKKPLVLPTIIEF